MLALCALCCEVALIWFMASACVYCWESCHNVKAVFYTPTCCILTKSLFICQCCRKCWLIGLDSQSVLSVFLCGLFGWHVIWWTQQTSSISFQSNSSPHISLISSGHPLVQSPLPCIWSPWWCAVHMQIVNGESRLTHRFYEVTFSFKSLIMMSEEIKWVL